MYYCLSVTVIVLINIYKNNITLTLNDRERKGEGRGERFMHNDISSVLELYSIVEHVVSWYIILFGKLLIEMRLNG